jgi:hypothetical protein
MVDDTFDFSYVRRVLPSLSDTEQVSFIQSYLLQPSLSRLTRVRLLEILGTLSIRSPLSAGTYFEQAASLLEQSWALTHLERTFAFFPHPFLRRALHHYLAARSLYTAARLPHSADRVERRITDLRIQMRREAAVPLYALSFFVASGFILAILSLSSSITGFSVVSGEVGSSFSMGVFLFVFSLIGFFFVVRLLGVSFIGKAQYSL